jgi:pimeloyl-ACP methyl ester carboxylesterase
MKTGSFPTTASGTDYSLHYKIWGDDNASTLVCIHGLTGNSQDFSYVGEYLAPRGYRVAALDVAGRGESAYFENGQDYNFDQYLHDIALFLNLLGCTQPASCDWLGVSMGGLLGMKLAGTNASPIRRLILSDVGPEVPKFDLEFIAKVVAAPAPVFKSLDDALVLFKMSAGTPYSRGPMNDAHWMSLVRFALKQLPDGTYTRNYDGKIADKFISNPLGDGDLWSYWEKIDQPVLALHGALSTLFPLRIATDMQRRKPNDQFTLKTIDGAGHVPSLFPDDQIAIIADWLAATAVAAA